MPLIKINIQKGHSKEFKRTLLDAVHTGLMEALQIADEDRFQRIEEFDPDYFETAPDKTENFCIIEITMFPGRTKAQKRLVIEKITEKLHEALGIAPQDVFIVMHSPDLENWGMRGRQLG